MKNKIIKSLMNIGNSLGRSELKQIVAGLDGSCQGSTNNCNCYCCTIGSDNCTWEGTLSTTCGGASHDCCQQRCQSMIWCPGGMYVAALCGGGGGC